MFFSFELASLKTASVEGTANAFSSLIESLIDINRQYLFNNPGFIALYSAAVVYEENPTSWKDIPALLSSGVGSCQDIAAWRIAELRQAGLDARIHIVLYRSQFRDLFHVNVAVDGKIEDPSSLVSKTRLSLLK